MCYVYGTDGKPRTTDSTAVVTQTTAPGSNGNMQITGANPVRPNYQPTTSPIGSFALPQINGTTVGNLKNPTMPWLIPMPQIKTPKAAQQPLQVNPRFKVGG